jgi:hypothetical protein
LGAIGRLHHHPPSAYTWSDVISGFSYLVYQITFSSTHLLLSQENVHESASRQSDPDIPRITLYRIANLVSTLYDCRTHPSDSNKALVSRAVAMIERATDADDDNAAREIVARARELASNL